MNLDPKQPCFIGPYSVTSGNLAIAEWIPDEQSGCFVTVEDGEVKKYQNLNIDGRVCRPDPGFVSLVRSGVVGSPTNLNLDATVEETYDQTVAYIRRAVHLEYDEQYFAVASYIALTWNCQAFDCVPYLRFTGDFGTGKTTALRAVAQAAYRSVVTSGVLRTASIFRLADRIKGTLLFDEADFRSSAAEADLVKILNCGYSKGAPVLRVGKNYQPQLFDVFGPKVISAREPFHDLALESRCLSIEMKSRSHGLEPVTSPEMIHEAEEIRNSYLALRLRNLIAPLPEDEVVIRENLLNSRFDARVIQIALPLLHATPDDHRQTVADFLCSTKLNYRRLRRETLQGQIITAYLESGLDTPRLKVIHRLLEHLSGPLPTVKALGAAAVRLGFERVHLVEGTAIRPPSDEWLTSIRRSYNV